MFWNNRRLSQEFVELSIGKIYFYEITKKTIDKAEKESIVNDKIKSVPLYFQTIEKEIVSLSKKQLENLSIKDTLKLRLKIKQILIDNNLFVEEKEPQQEFQLKEIEWFDKQKVEQIQKIKRSTW